MSSEDLPAGRAGEMGAMIGVHDQTGSRTALLDGRAQRLPSNSTKDRRAETQR